MAKSIVVRMRFDLPKGETVTSAKRAVRKLMGAWVDKPMSLVVVQHVPSRKPNKKK